MRHQPMSRTVRRCLAAGAAMLATAIGLFGTATPASGAAQQVRDFTVVNSFSYEPGLQARGGFLTIFTTVPVTGESSTFEPWRQETPNGLYVSTNACTAGGGQYRLPILYVGPAFAGSQLNVYVPNSIDPQFETFGICDNSGNDTVTVHPAAGFGADITKPVPTVVSRPGIAFTDGNVPVGYHFNAFTTRQTPLTDCAADPASCPVAVQGVVSQVVIFLTGAEVFGCGGSKPACTPQSPARFTLTDTSTGSGFQQRLFILGRDGLGREGAGMVLVLPGGGGDYLLRVTTPGVNSQQALSVRVGPQIF